MSVIMKAATREIRRGLFFKRSVLHEGSEDFFLKILVVVERKLRHQRQQDMRGTDPTSVLPSPFRRKDLSLSTHSYLAWQDLPNATLSRRFESARLSTSIMFL